MKLAIQNTTDLIYTKFPSLKGLGQRLKASKGYEKGVNGLLLHTTLAVSMECVPLGIAKQTSFTFDEVKKKRGHDASNRRGIHKDFPITEKTSGPVADDFQQPAAYLADASRRSLEISNAAHDESRVRIEIWPPGAATRRQTI